MKNVWTGLPIAEVKGLYSIIMVVRDRIAFCAYIDPVLSDLQYRYNLALLSVNRERVLIITIPIQLENTNK